ncbi:MAG TPA: glycosyltransferase family 2 protein [Thermoanaerobaculia bacterium]|nr:glycosyltransferase family 2 protein [Thermoanaerobaculia bacterium]
MSDLAGEPPRLTVVLPIYNERDSVGAALERYRAAFAAQGLADYELLVVDDGSHDGCGDVAANLADGEPRLRVIRHQRNQGQMAALRTGFTAARGSIVTHNGIDLPFAPEQTLAALAPFAAGADAVVVERRNRGANGPWRWVVSWGNALVWKLFFGSPFADHNFVQFFRRDLVNRLPVLSRGVNTVTAELLLRAHWAGHRVVRLQAPYDTRTAGRSTVGLRGIVRAVAETARLRWLLLQRR